jgi:nicotinamidase-related amidase
MTLDPKKTAVLTLDFQTGILAMVDGGASAIQAAARVVGHAREKGFPIIHVGLGFSEGHPEIPEHGRFAMVKQNNLFVRGTPSAEFHKDLVLPSDLIVYKQRVSAFVENNLDMILRARGVTHLVFFGFATSGIVLSTIRQASDLDYQCTVIGDACFDRDPEVHRVLTEKVFAAQGRVITAEAFIAEQK